MTPPIRNKVYRLCLSSLCNARDGLTISCTHAFSTATKRVATASQIAAASSKRRSVASE
jgi:hypothetical protein